MSFCCAVFKSVVVSAIVLAIGCSTATKPVTTAGKIAIKTTTIGGKVAGQTVKTAGSVAAATTKTAVKTTGTIATTTIKTAGSVATMQLVTFKDVTTGALKQVPWEDGLKLYAASKSADIDLYMKAFTIFRDGGARVIKGDYNKLKKGAPEPELKPGDFIEVKPLPASKTKK